MNSSSDDQFDGIIKDLRHESSVAYADDSVRSPVVRHRSDHDAYQIESVRYLAGFRQESWSSLGDANPESLLRQVGRVTETRVLKGGTSTAWIGRAKSESATALRLPSGATRSRRAAAVVGYAVLYRAFWSALSFIGILWGVALGASFPGEKLLDLGTAVTGTIVLLGLIATLFVAGRQSRHTR